MIGHSIFALALALSFMCLAYEGMAEKLGWPVGEILAKPASVPKLVAFLTQITALGHAFIAFSWWSPIVVLVCGYCVAAVVTMRLREGAQAVAVIGVFPAFAATLLYYSEEYPLGFISKAVAG